MLGVCEDAVSDTVSGAKGMAATSSCRRSYSVDLCHQWHAATTGVVICEGKRFCKLVRLDGLVMC